jgi:hypothetical protein
MEPSASEWIVQHDQVAPQTSDPNPGAFPSVHRVVRHVPNYNYRAVWVIDYVTGIQDPVARALGGDTLTGTPGAAGGSSQS